MSDMEARLRAAALNYVRCQRSGHLSPLIAENGLWGKSPWAELVDIVDELYPPHKVPRPAGNSGDGDKAKEDAG